MTLFCLPVYRTVNHLNFFLWKIWIVLFISHPLILLWLLIAASLFLFFLLLLNTLKMKLRIRIYFRNGNIGFLRVSPGEDTPGRVVCFASPYQLDILNYHSRILFY